MKHILEKLNITLEAFRLTFLFERDDDEEKGIKGGIGEVKRFTRQTEKIYRQTILQKKYWQSSRRGFIVSYVEFRRLRHYFDSLEKK